MNYEDTLILGFLRQSPETFFSRKEISRRAIKRTDYEANPRWADAPLAALTDRGLIEVDNNSCFRFKKSF